MEQELTLFDKLYCCYYQAVRQILEEAACSPVSQKRMEEICEATAFKESALSILPRLTGQDGPWICLLHKTEDGLFFSALGDKTLSAPFPSSEVLDLLRLPGSPLSAVFHRGGAGFDKGRYPCSVSGGGFLLLRSFSKRRSLFQRHVPGTFSNDSRRTL